MARWRSERAAPPPVRVVIADDTLAADKAYRLACEGTALLWRGDFQNARHLLQALARRTDKPTPRSRKKTGILAGLETSPAQAFHLHRQAQAQRARVLAMLLVEMGEDYRIALKRAPDVRLACEQVWGPADGAAATSVCALRELLGLVSAHEWRKKGVAIAALGNAPSDRIHPHYGVFSPVRGEYVELVASTALPGPQPVPLAFDIGTGSGVLAALLARRGVARVEATDSDARARACANDNIARLGLSKRVAIVEAELFPEGRAPLVVCNPPWLPARASSPIEHAIYDEDSRMLRGFLAGLAAHLTPGGEGWLILSDLAEHLGLRSRAELLTAIAGAGLVVAGRTEVHPAHPKAGDAADPLHQARAREVTSLWRLTVAEAQADAP
ncbi:MAG: class I SAM-dependent methyltransferase [Polaromonas sp.]|nr:class I SAM-dependent methyltransferase [Polaromonas sp.]